jgi:hypothetical protein
MPEGIPHAPKELSHEDLRGVQYLVDGEDEPVELLTFDRELLPACGSQGVMPSAPVVLGCAPLGLDPAPQEESLQGWIEGALADLQDVLRHVLKRWEMP